jgi:hypothetical protein
VQVIVFLIDKSSPAKFTLFKRCAGHLVATGQEKEDSLQISI